MKYKGQLSIHSEMECGSWIQFHADNGLYGPNLEYWDWDWTINFGKHTIINNIKVYENEKVIYDGKLTFQRGRHSMQIHYPLELTFNEWVSYGKKGLIVIIDTDIILPSKT